jgi:quinol monooxygenase YgiN
MPSDEPDPAPIEPPCSRTDQAETAHDGDGASREFSWRSPPPVMNLADERGLFKAARERRTAVRLQRPAVREGSSHTMGTAPDGSTQGMFLASIGFRIQPHKRDEVLSAVDETVRRMRQASGCARSRLMADAEDPNAFTVLSEWQSADTADTFFSSRDFQIFKGIRILLRDEPVLVLDDVRSRVTRLLRGQ